MQVAGLFEDRKWVLTTAVVSGAYQNGRAEATPSGHIVFLQKTPPTDCSLHPGSMKASAFPDPKIHQELNT